MHYYCLLLTWLTLGCIRLRTPSTVAAFGIIIPTSTALFVLSTAAWCASRWSPLLFSLQEGSSHWWSTFGNSHRRGGLFVALWIRSCSNKSGLPGTYRVSKDRVRALLSLLWLYKKVWCPVACPCQGTLRTLRLPQVMGRSLHRVLPLKFQSPLTWAFHLRLSCQWARSAWLASTAAVRGMLFPGRPFLHRSIIRRRRTSPSLAPSAACTVAAARVVAVATTVRASADYWTCWAIVCWRPYTFFLVFKFK